MSSSENDGCGCLIFFIILCVIVSAVDSNFSQKQKIKELEDQLSKLQAATRPATRPAKTIKAEVE